MEIAQIDSRPPTVSVGPSVGVVVDTPDAPTRERVARSILEHGPSTAASLADRLALTPAAVRRHLDHLITEGVLTAREPRPLAQRGRGRPARVFALTELGRDEFDQAYDDLALEVLRFVAETGGAQAITAFAERRVADLEQRYAPRLSSVPHTDRAQALATALSEDGYAASVRGTAHSEQLCQHHCPVAHVATEFPQLCEAETAAIGRLLGQHVQRLATIAHGDGICTTNLPHPIFQPASSSRERPSI